MAGRWCGSKGLSLVHLVLAMSGTLTGAPVAHADSPKASSPPANLSWDAPAECPSAAAVLERLSDLLGQTAADWSRYERVSVSIRRAASSSWQLSLELRRGGDVQRRSLSAPRCDELANAAAVALAIALGDDEAPSAESTPSAPVAESVALRSASAPAVPRDAASEPPTATERRGAHAQVVLGAEALLDTPTLGGAALGFGLHADVRFARFGAGLYGLSLPRRSESVGAAGASHVDFALLSAGVRGCYRVLDGRAHADGCVSFEAGRLSAAARGLRESESTRDLWLAAGPGLELGWDIVAALGLHARAEALLPLVRDEYVVDRTETVNATPAAALRLALGLSVPIQ